MGGHRGCPLAQAQYMDLIGFADPPPSTVRTTVFRLGGARRDIHATCDDGIDHGAHPRARRRRRPSRRTNRRTSRSLDHTARLYSRGVPAADGALELINEVTKPTGALAFRKFLRTDAPVLPIQIECHGSRLLSPNESALLRRRRRARLLPRCPRPR
jgi:hypothetical protein